MGLDAGLSSDALVARMAEEDQEALSALYDRHRGLIFALALRILGDRAEAEEVLSDVFFQAWRSAAGFDPLRGSVTAWLVMLCRSRAIDRLRRRAARREPARPEDVPTATTASGAREMDEAVEARMHRDRIVSALGALSAEQRDALDLAYYGGFSHAEIAARLGQPLGTVKSRIRQALLTLRKNLGGCHAV